MIFRPDLEYPQNRAVIVLSNNDGCVVARNKAAKALGIQMAQPFYQIKELVQERKVVFFSSNYALYGDLSSRVMQTLSQFSPEMEVYSIDEAFLGLEGFKDYDFLVYGKSIKQKVYKDIHIPVSVGIAPTKVLAKIANHLAKKYDQTEGVVDLSNSRFHDKALSLVSVEDIWGVGRQSATKLRALGVKNAKDFRDFPNEKLIEKLFTKIGLQIKHELQGVACIPLELFAEKKKQIISSRTFGHPVYHIEELRESVANYITTAAERLRKQESVTTLLSVYLRTNPFKNTPQYYNIGSYSFTSGTSDTRKLIRAGFSILDQIYRPGFEYKKTGVLFNHLHDKSGVQLSLFDPGDSAKDDTLMQVIDQINKREGRNSVKWAACGIENRWSMARHFTSPCYTTRWSEIIRVA